ncbi:hypothetical protein XELAEV_18035799mg [Xenopus laevis]|uniref:Uncharacterized protein n=1 Tax=Xenopus laevis TaxID=8355 RepID=A0A974CGE9_XENLA|nr:hypothetical protein XELAEV_18035799mg [Xenopus laevis]
MGLKKNKNVMHFNIFGGLCLIVHQCKGDLVTGNAGKVCVQSQYSLSTAAWNTNILEGFHICICSNVS